MMSQATRSITVTTALLLANAAAGQDLAYPAGLPAGSPAVSPAGPLANALPAEVTFSKHIAPILFNNCTSCHRPGEGAPFALMTYKQISRKARMIAKVTKSRFMPPWLPAKGHGRFAGEHRLTDEQIELIQKWVKTGKKEGDLKRLPRMPKFTEGWQLGKPDLIVKMPKGFVVPAGGRDIYRNFVVPVDNAEDRWVTAIEVRPSARAVLHHIIFGIDTTGESRRLDGRDGRPGFSGMRGRSAGRNRSTSTSGLGGWAVGGQPRHLPMGLARHLPKGSDLILRSHFHPSGKKEVEQTVLGLHFAKRPPKRRMVGLQLPPLFGYFAGLNVSAGEKNFKLKDSYTLAYDAQALTVGGHAHYICREMQVWATLPGSQTRKSIFWINRWAFNWQNRYQYDKPFDLPKGTRIDVEITYDNSSDNPSNPNDPPKRIRWGRESFDEMGSVTLLMVAKHERDSRALSRDIRDASRRSMSRGRGGLAGILAQSLRRLDRNGDGKVSADEVPPRYKRYVERFDTNKDGTLDEKELEAIANGAGRRRR